MRNLCESYGASRSKTLQLVPDEPTDDETSAAADEPPADEWQTSAGALFVVVGMPATGKHTVGGKCLVVEGCARFDVDALNGEMIKLATNSRVAASRPLDIALPVGGRHLSENGTYRCGDPLDISWW